MAQRIVDDFEMVQIQAQYRQRLPVALAMRQQQTQMIAKHRAIGQPGQQIVVSLIMNGFFSLLAFGNILDHAIAANKAPLEGVFIVFIHAGGGQFNRLIAALH